MTHTHTHITYNSISSIFLMVPFIRSEQLNFEFWLNFSSLCFLADISIFCIYVWWRLNLQAQDFSLQILSKHGAQKNWWFMCMTKHGVCTPRSLTLWKKEMFHYWCPFLRWGILVFSLSYHHSSHSWIVQGLEFGNTSSGCQRVLIWLWTSKTLLGTWVQFISRIVRE